MLKIINYEAKKKNKKKRRRERQRPTRMNVIRKERWKRYSMNGHNSRRREEDGEGGREREAAQFMPLSPCSEDSSLGGLRL